MESFGIQRQWTRTETTTRTKTRKETEIRTWTRTETKRKFQISSYDRCEERARKKWWNRRIKNGVVDILFCWIYFGIDFRVFSSIIVKLKLHPPIIFL